MGGRNTSENWANNGWQFIEDFRLSVLRDIADRAADIYHVTGAYQCARGMSELSMHWTTPSEQERFDKEFEDIYRYARKIDYTMDRTRGASPWSDFGLTLEWQRHSQLFEKLPVYKVLQDVTARSGEKPLRTGVYVSLDDPDATLQFAWAGSDSGVLLNTTTFNELGKAALTSVGRGRIWVNEDAMLEFVLQNLSRPELLTDPFYEESRTPDLAPSLVARNAFCSKSSRWCYVQQSTDEFEDIEKEHDDPVFDVRRFRAGEVCTVAGWYFTPAHSGSRRKFIVGEVFPDLASGYGKTIWQLDVTKGR